MTWNSPEGTDWIQMDHCEELNFTQVSVGPSGLLWVLQWDGIALARLGISHQNPMGRPQMHFISASCINHM